MRLNYLVLLAVLCCTACSVGQNQDQILSSYPLDGLTGLEATPFVVFDAARSYDGHGAVRVKTDSTVSVPLLVVDDVHIDGAFLVYQAAVRTTDVSGKAYLEMWCRVDDAEYFSRDLGTPLAGTNDWSIQTTPFRLEKGQASQLIRLNLVIEGSGTVWIDDIKLLRSPL